MSRFVPRSKLGAAIAVAYLLLVFFLLAIFHGGEGGLHGSAAFASLFVVIITLPLSLGVIRIADLLKPAMSTGQLDYLFLAMLAVCGIINAAVIYIAVGFTIQALRALTKKR